MDSCILTYTAPYIFRWGHISHVSIIWWTIWNEYYHSAVIWQKEVSTYSFDSTLDSCILTYCLLSDIGRIIQDCLTNSILWDLYQFVLKAKEREGGKASAWERVRERERERERERGGGFKIATNEQI